MISGHFHLEKLKAYALCFDYKPYLPAPISDTHHSSLCFCELVGSS